MPPPLRPWTGVALLALFAAPGGVIDAAAASPLRSTLREFVRVVDSPWRRIGLTVTVTDRKGRPVRGLSREDFRIFEDDRAVETADFGSEGARLDRPLSVAVLLDMSESMQKQVKKVREAAEALLGQLRPRDEIMVARFNDEITVLQSFTGDRRDPERTLARIGRAWGGTAIFRSLAETLRDLRERPGRKVIIVVSDGLDNDVARGQNVLQSLYIQDLLRLCLRTQTLVYGIRPGMSASSWLPFEGFVEQTGGRLLYTGGDLERLFERLGEEFQSQYYLGYDVDPKTRGAAWRRIRVQVSHPDLIVRSIGGYAPAVGRVRTLLADLESDDAERRADAAYEIGFSGDARAVPSLLAAIVDREEKVRRLAAEALGRLGDPAAIAPLVERLGDHASSVRESAAGCLLVFGAAAVPALVDRLSAAGGAGAGQEIEEVARTLGKIGDDRAIDPLVLLLGSGPAATRLAAAEALGELGLSGGIPALRRALADGDRAVRGAALHSIVAIAGPASRAVVEDYLRRETDPDLRRRALDAIE
jgi:Ca-activated chloride channel homolog